MLALKVVSFDSNDTRWMNILPSKLIFWPNCLKKTRMKSSAQNRRFCSASTTRSSFTLRSRFLWYFFVALMTVVDGHGC